MVEEKKEGDVLKYKHPFKNAPRYYLISPSREVVNGRPVRNPGVAIPLINFRYETDDPKIQELIAKDRMFHKHGIELLGKNDPEVLVPKPKPPQYRKGIARLIDEHVKVTG